MRTVATAALVVVLSLAGASPAPAAGKCTLSATGVAFGAYNVFGTGPLDSTGTLTVGCNGRTTIKITLDNGGASTFDRRLVNSQQLLQYNLYLDVARSSVWGDGTGATGVYRSTTNAWPLLLTVYGRIPARQDVKSNNGSLYTDAIVATITF